MPHTFLLSFALTLASQGLAMQQTEERIEVQVQRTDALDYLLAVPEAYHADGDPVPLILFLHGAGERGDDLSKIKAWGPPRMIEEGHDFGAVVVSPQCPPDTYWPDHAELLIALLDKIEDEYRIDQDRVYVTGLSMGGYGTFALCARQPDRFAAAVPICGGGTLIDAWRISELPMWVFHGDADNVVPVEESARMVRYMNQRNGTQAKLTVYPGTGHNSWSQAYADPAMWDWLFEQERE